MLRLPFAHRLLLALNVVCSEQNASFLMLGAAAILAHAQEGCSQPSCLLSLHIQNGLLKQLIAVNLTFLLTVKMRRKVRGVACCKPEHMAHYW